MRNKKKLTIISISGIKDFVGGAETFNLELCGQLSKRGHKIINLFAATEKVNDSSFNQEYYYKLGKINLFDINVIGIFNLVFALNRILKKNNPDLIYLHLYLPPIALMIFSKFYRLPKIVHAYGVWYKEFESLHLENIKKSRGIALLKFKLGICIRRHLQKLMLTSSNNVIALSKFHANQISSLLGIDKRKISIIGGGVSDVNFFASKKSKSRLKNELGFSDKKLILIVSRIEPRKGILEAIQSMKIVAKKIDATLLIISPHYDGTFLHYLSECYESVSELDLGGRVLFKTGLAGARLRPYYQASDCFLMPSVSLETFGLTMVEAMKSGTIVVGSNAGNISEILNKIDSPFLVKKIVPKLLANKISECLLASDQKKHLLIERGLKLSKKFSWQSRAIELERLFYQSIAVFNRIK